MSVTGGVIKTSSVRKKVVIDKVTGMLDSYRTVIKC